MIKLFSRSVLISLFLTGLILSPLASAQDQSAPGHDHESSPQDSSQMNRSGGNHEGVQGNGRMRQMSGGDHEGAGMMQMSGGDHEGGGMMRMHQQMMQRTTPSGQSAMAVLSDVINRLQSNPDTDWSQVNIEALRQHLIDMDRVALYATAQTREIDGGARFTVSGDDERTIAAIKRMVPAHAAQIQAELEWDTSTEINGNAVILTVLAQDENDVAMIRALGFAGFMALGDHHADHHLMIAGGQPEHDGMDHGSANQGSHQGH